MTFRAFALTLVIGLWSTISAGWSATGHRVVAEIAYAHLNPVAKQMVDRLTYVPGEHYSGQSRFIYISTWADVIRAKGNYRYSQWHFIDLPLTADGMAGRPARYPNVLSAINKSTSELTSHDSSLKTKRLHLKLLVHFVGDIHQPMHAVSRYDKKHPRGDFGGTRYRIRARRAKNLHQYWDQGVGLFQRYNQRYPLRRGNLKKLATDIETEFPQAAFSATYLNRPPQTWALESLALAKRVAYQLPENSRPSWKYRQKGQKVVKKRLALAGYRLAAALNAIYH